MMRGRRLGPANLTWLMDCADQPPSDEDLAAFAEYGTFIGPDKVRWTSKISMRSNRSQATEAGFLTFNC